MIEIPMAQLISGRQDYTDYLADLLDSADEGEQAKHSITAFLSSQSDEEVLMACYLLISLGDDGGFQKASDWLREVSKTSADRQISSPHRLHQVDESFGLIAEALGNSGLDRRQADARQIKLMKAILMASNSIYFGDRIANPLMFVEGLKEACLSTALECVKRNMEELRVVGQQQWLVNQTRDIVSSYPDASGLGFADADTVFK